MTDQKQPGPDEFSEVVETELTPAVLREKQLAFVKWIVDEIPDIVSRKINSAEYLWREFFELSDRLTGSKAVIIDFLFELGYVDEKVYKWLVVADYTTREIAERLSEAKWADARIIDAVFNAHEDLPGRDQESDANNDIILFTLSCGWDDARIMKVLHYLDCLNPTTLEYLDLLDWDKPRILKAIISADCFNDCIYQMLLGLRNPSAMGSEKPIWTTKDFVRLMDEFGISNCDKVALFKQAQVPSGKILLSFSLAGWPTGRAIDAFRAFGLTIGEIAAAFAAIASYKTKVEDSAKKLSQTAPMLQPVKDHCSILRLASISPADKQEVINVFSYFKLPDDQVFTELNRCDWPNFAIVDYLLAADRQPREIIASMLKAGWTEFYITKMINEQAKEFSKKQNDYWTVERVQKWKQLLAQIIKGQSD